MPVLRAELAHSVDDLGERSSPLGRHTEAIGKGVNVDRHRSLSRGLIINFGKVLHARTRVHTHINICRL